MADKELIDSAVAEKVVTLFAQEKAVAEIYTLTSGGELTFWIVTSDEVYDAALMRRMIDYEWQIKRAASMSVEFEFVPLALSDNVSDVVGDKSSLLYKS